MQALIDVLKECYPNDVLEYPSKAQFPATGIKGKYYIDTTAVKAYTWNGNEYVEMLYPDCPYTVFPDASDTITRKMDIDSTTYSLINRYQEYISVGNFAEAATLIENNPKMKRIIFGAEDINRIRDGLVAVERVFNSYIAEYIAKVVKPRGTWSATTAYKKYNVVQYVTAEDQALEYYIALPVDYSVVDIPIGTPPTNTNYWSPVTLRGPQGATGSGYAPKGEYNSTTTYSKNDCVSYSDCVWYAKQTTCGNEPNLTSSYWGYFGSFSNEKYYTSFELLPANWVTNTDTDSNYYPYKYEYTINNVNNYTRADASFDNQSVVLGSIAGIAASTSTTTNKVVFKSVTIPSSTLKGQLSIEQKVKDTPLPIDNTDTLIDGLTGQTYSLGIYNGELYYELKTT